MVADARRGDPASSPTSRMDMVSAPWCPSLPGRAGGAGRPRLPKRLRAPIAGAEEPGGGGVLPDASRGGVRLPRFFAGEKGSGEAGPPPAEALLHCAVEPAVVRWVEAPGQRLRKSLASARNGSVTTVMTAWAMARMTDATAPAIVRSTSAIRDMSVGYPQRGFSIAAAGAVGTAAPFTAPRGGA
ncbi:hypothetical protein GCM10023224_34680 [Streptomonospora halophila]|uniref:Uncharacterized protein n=1 Tax=Streptomonospora halophila TaxID=427369 RepID=A0ABP9GM61_9ACTN